MIDCPIRAQTHVIRQQFINSHYKCKKMAVWLSARGLRIVKSTNAAADYCASTLLENVHEFRHELMLCPIRLPALTGFTFYDAIDGLAQNADAVMNRFDIRDILIA